MSGAPRMRSASVRRLLSEGNGRENSKAVGFSNQPPPLYVMLDQFFSPSIGMDGRHLSAIRVCS